MSDTINVPGFGPQKKIYVGIAAVGVVGLGVWWYRKHQAMNGTTTSATTPDQPIDPATGFPEGSPEDMASLAAQQSGGSAGGYTGANSPDTTAQTGGFTTNGQWAQAVEDYLVTVVGESGTIVGNALGKYITGQAVTEEQATIVQQAIAFEGYPPTAGPDGYPPSVRNAPAPPSPGPAKIAIPSLRGDRMDVARARLEKLGLKVSVAPWARDSKGIKWVLHTTPGAGVKVMKGSTVHLDLSRTKP